MLRVRLVGRPSLEWNGEALAWPAGRRAGELLAWLAVHPGMHARADLAPRFWPDVLDESARASLRTALHGLRRDLGDAAVHLVSGRDGIGLDDGVWVDVRELRRPQAGALALEILDGELLQGVDAEWVHAARDEHREIVGDLLRRLSAGADPDDALRLARRRAALDPLAEGPVRDLMRLLAGNGDRAAAIAAYEALRARMGRDLRAAPSAATRRLADEIRGGGAAAPGAAGTGGVRRLSDRLADESRRTFVGRVAEVEQLRGVISQRRPATPLVFLSGPGGVGKSRLLRAVLADADADLRVVGLDCRDIEPTPGGFLRALSDGLGATAWDPSPEFTADLMALDDRRTVLALDSYESFRLLDSWLRRTFLPLLPEHALTIIAGRAPPGRAWLTAPGWRGLIAHIPLGPLEEADSLRLLGMHGVPPVPARHANRFARGHPLALELAAAAVRAQPGLELTDGPPAAVIGQLVEAFLEGLPAESVEVVRVASVLRRVDESLLEALLDVPATTAYATLAELPFCRSTSDGLVLHEVVRAAVARDLAVRDPRRAARLRRRAAASIGGAPATGGWQHTADLLYLLGNPVVRDAFFPPGASDHAIEPALAGDEAAVAAIAATWDPPEWAGALRRWWTRHPGALSVARGPDGAVSGFSVVQEMAGVDPALARDDPMLAAMRRHLDARPMAPGERALVARRFLTAEAGEAPHPAMAALFLDLKRLYMQMRPDLRRVYASQAVAAGVTDPDEVLGGLGFVPAGEALTRGDVRHLPLVLDFGPGSVDGWLARLIDAESHADPGSRHHHGAPAAS